MKTCSALLVVSLICACMSAMIVTDTSALPIYSRVTKEPCSSCHSVWPQLTVFGRDFKESGYDAGNEEVAAKLSWYELFPISARLNMRLADKRTSKTKTSDTSDKDKRLKMRAFHELEIFMSGSLAEDFSFFVELEGEDEIVNNPDDQRGFNVWVNTGVLEYRAHESVSFSAGMATPFFADPYNTINHKRTNRYSRKADGLLPSMGQFVSVSGRKDRVFYLVSLGDHADGSSLDLEGHDPYDVSGRVAVDLTTESDGTPGVMVGAFASRTHGRSYVGSGADSTAVAKYGASGLIDSFDWNTFGADAQIDYKGLHLNMIFVTAEDTVDTDGNSVGDETTSDYVFTTEGHYLRLSDDRPLYGPSVIFEKFTKKDGAEDWSRLGVFFSAFPRENVKIQFGWEGDVSAPSRYTDKESRFTIVVDAAI